ncbi:isochorismatase family protein [Nocardia sp. 348MFTsu5.1]|uniref:isochorismatase family protein n=1 Tax=Nocardia sp. 348MFTsu5.1 TaxID=1172185 RepID=UPI00035E61BA|nr:isochorismatase family protein [Nocardia sp. 348MFTsu5.1]
MAIPAIDPYELPNFSAIPDNNAPWVLAPERAALLIHDMQNYFIDAYRSDEEPMSTVMPNIALIRQWCARLQIPVIFTMQPGDQHPSRRGLLSDLWGPGLTVGRDTEVVSELAPLDSDIQVTKWRYSAFQRTDLRELLSHHGRDQLLVTGVYAHMGCMLSAAEAFMTDIQPFFVADATADFTRDEHEMALSYVAKRCAVVTTTDDVIGVLRHAAAA